jgi:hypothetical protein
VLIGHSTSVAALRCQLHRGQYDESSTKTYSANQRKFDLANAFSWHQIMHKPKRDRRKWITSRCDQHEKILALNDSSFREIITSTTPSTAYSPLPMTVWMAHMPLSTFSLKDPCNTVSVPAFLARCAFPGAVPVTSDLVSALQCSHVL